MPEISRFFGIIITMNYNDHAPPHFHARYGGDQALVDIQTLQANGGLRDTALTDAAQAQPWDPSVQALVVFPAVLSMMDNNLQCAGTTPTRRGRRRRRSPPRSAEPTSRASRP